jgi:hypothetical protein
MEKVIRTLLQRDINNITLFADSKGARLDLMTAFFLPKTCKIELCVPCTIYTGCSTLIAFQLLKFTRMDSLLSKVDADH